MPQRTPENVLIDNVCPSCHRRIWDGDEPALSKRRYIPPKWFREMFRTRIGTYPLGYYRLAKCEVCQKKMAIFDTNKGPLRDTLVVLFACTLLSYPLDDCAGISCEDLKSCYACPLKKNEQYVEKK